MPTISPSDDSEIDVQILIDRVAELERTQRREDVEGFLSLFDPAAVWVTGGGQRLIGLDVIAAFTRQVLPDAMSDGSVNYEVEHVASSDPMLRSPVFASNTSTSRGNRSRVPRGDPPTSGCELPRAG